LYVHADGDLAQPPGEPIDFLGGEPAEAGQEGPLVFVRFHGRQVEEDRGSPAAGAAL
jgi:hypothetical protein